MVACGWPWNEARFFRSGCLPSPYPPCPVDGIVHEAHQDTIRWGRQKYFVVDAEGHIGFCQRYESVESDLREPDW